MSTLPNSASLFPEWKREVNRRVAAHLNRKAPLHGETAAPEENHPAPTSRAARAAARVAARYANAPSYGDVLAREARAGVHAAKAASEAAQQAQAAFQYVLDGLEAVASAEPSWEQERQPEGFSDRHAVPVAVPPPQSAPQRPQELPRSPADLPSVQPLPAIAPAIAPSWELESDALQEEPAGFDALPGYDSPTILEAHAGDPVQPIYANLIQFPREMVATRRARPRRAEGPLAAAGSTPQLSIFEVDPAAISILPPPATVDAPAPPAWMRPEWSTMTLEAQPPSIILDAQPVEELLEEPAPQPAAAHEIELAPLSRRLLAIVVDCTLIAAALVAAATLAASNFSEFPGVRVIEFGAGIALLAIGAAYYAGFLTLTRATPGMRYAGIELSTFSGLRATRAQRCGRLMAMLLSVLPLGLGVVWALFDEGHLSWHDRLSRTYVHKR
ncbi:MAG: RDD family protein [Terracidiphilus sp.]